MNDRYVTLPAIFRVNLYFSNRSTTVRPIACTSCKTLHPFGPSSNEAAIHIPDRETHVLDAAKARLFHPPLGFRDGMILTSLRCHTLRQIQQRRPTGRRALVVQELCL